MKQKKQKAEKELKHDRGHRVTGRYHVYKGDIYTAFFRALLVIVGIVLQFLVMLLLSILMARFASIPYVVLELIGIIFAVYIVYDSEAYRHFWLVIILMLPVTGLFLYFMWGSRVVSARTRKKLRNSIAQAQDKLPKQDEILDSKEMQENGQLSCARYLASAGMPLYKNTAVRYYPLGDDMREDFLSDLRSAKKRIWMEFFIVSGGEIWDEVETILAEKVREGVDVRFLIDDVGSIRWLNRAFKRRMKEIGVQLSIFAPIHEDLTKLSLNYRNHQKIVVVDDKVGYTGGINLADEYFNIYPKYGHWKDTAVRFEGEATACLATMFAGMWNYAMRKHPEALIPMDFLGACEGYGDGLEGESIVQPFYSGPLKSRYNNADMIYQSIMSHAKKTLWITTPYLVLDRTMSDALIRAAKSGVDVRLYTPRHYDKWYVYQVTEASYGRLLKEGIRIFEYVPGFIHAKDLLVDDECAICGSVNLDYRSFYFQYECGAIFYGGQTVRDIRENMIETERICEEIILEKWKRRPWHKKLISRVLCFFSPLF